MTMVDTGRWAHASAQQRETGKREGGIWNPFPNRMKMFHLEGSATRPCGATRTSDSALPKRGEGANAGYIWEGDVISVPSRVRRAWLGFQISRGLLCSLVSTLVGSALFEGGGISPSISSYAPFRPASSPHGVFGPNSANDSSA